MNVAIALVTALSHPVLASVIIQTVIVVFPVVLELVVFDEDEQAEATSATDAVAHATATSFLRFTTFLRWTVSGSHRCFSGPATLSSAGLGPVRTRRGIGRGAGGSRAVVRMV